MRFTVAWADVLSQNTLFKWLLFLMAMLCIVLGTGLIFVAQKDPLVIERACFSGILATKDTAPTSGEVKAFVVEALNQRFDSTTGTFPAFLSIEERSKAQKDREELASKKIKQRLLINSVDIKENKITVDTDRIISVDEIRTAFRFPIEVQVATIARSERNPYGLVLTLATPIQIQGK
jgi:hypothetical protein